MTGRASHCFLVLGICLLASAVSGVELEFFEEDYAVNEGATTTVTIVKHEENQFPITINIIPLTYSQYRMEVGPIPIEIENIINTQSPTPAQFDSAPGGRRDFSDTVQTVTFPANPADDDMEVQVGAVDDLLNEAMEGYVIQIAVSQINPVDNATLTLVRGGVALVRITDNDEISIEFSVTEVTVLEDAGVVSDQVALRKTVGVESEQNLTVLIGALQNTATAGEDYVSFSNMPVLFTPSVSSIPLSFEILNDTAPESPESFFLQITLPQNPALNLVRSPLMSQVVVNINDDDGSLIQVGFTQDVYQVMEGETAVIEYAILSDLALVGTTDFATFNIEIFVASASAVDFSSVGFPLFGFLDRFTSPRQITVATTEDTVDEGNEEFLLRLTLQTGVGSSVGDFEVVRDQATVVILDDDGVAVLPLELVPAPLLTGIEGETVTFSCGPLNSDNITLLVNGQVETAISFDDSTGNRTYTLFNLTRNMNGSVYQCTAGSRMSQITTLLVYYAPGYMVGDFFEGNEGEPLDIFLTLDGFPLPPDTFSWTFQGQPLMDTPGRVTTGVDFLQFSALNRDDRGTYMVTATNLAGSGSATFNLEVYYGPSYTSDLLYQLVEGAPGNIQLMLDARPLPGAGDFGWMFNGQSLVGSSNLVLTVDSLAWSTVSRNDSGEYSVSATNRAGTGTATFVVQVIYPPRYTVSDRIVVIEGELVRVDLALDANPIPLTARWEFNGQPLSAPSGGELGVDFIDFGSSINRNASGTYFIESTNDAGTGNATFQLVVYVVPRYTVNASFSVMEGDPFDLTLELDAIPLPSTDNVTWYFNGQVLAMMPGIMLGRDFITISMVTRLDAGTYRVEATNEAGTGSASFQLQVTIPVSTPVPTTTTMIPMPSSTVPVPMTTTPVPISVTPTPTPTTDPPVVTTEPTTTVFGDPHFSVLLPNGQLLCYSVQGEHGYSFNLVSNQMIQINARFVPDAKREEVTWIGSLGIVITSKKVNQTRMRFEAAEKAIHIGDKFTLHVKKINKLTFSGGKLTISEALRDKKEKHLRVDVELSDLRLAFSVDFVGDHLDMSWSKVGRQPPSSHGIIGQFFRPHIEIDEARRLLVLPDMDPVPVMRKPVWHFMERESPDEQLCWVAMNPGYQGKKLLQGHYLDYLVNDVLSTDFKFKPRKHKKSKRSVHVD